MTDDAEEPQVHGPPSPPSYLEALAPVALLVTLIVLGVVIYGADLTGGPVQVALIFCAIVAGLIGVKNGHSIERLGKAAVDAISPR